MTKLEALSYIVANVKTLTDAGDSDAPKMTVFADHYYGMACGMTGYEELPDSLMSYVQDAVLKAWRKRGAEELNGSTALGVNEQYYDIDEKLRKHLRTKRNPLSTNCRIE